MMGLSTGKDRAAQRVSCPLCCGRDTVEVGRYPAGLVTALYHRLGVDASLPTSFIRYLQCRDCSLGFFDPMVGGGEAFYEALQRHDWYYLEDKPEYRMAAKYLPPAGRVLEIGAGKGAFARFCGGHRYTGLEFSPAAIERARAEGLVLRRESVEAHAASFPGAYAAVVSFQVLEHVSDPRLFIASASGCLAPGGRLILAVPAQDGFVGTAINDALNAPPHHLTRWPDGALAKVAELFEMDLLAIEHEPVAAIHALPASAAVWRTRLWRLFGASERLFDARLSARVGLGLSTVLGRLLPQTPADGYGHTVLAAYQAKPVGDCGSVAPPAFAALNGAGRDGAS